MLKVYVVDHHPIERLGIRRILSDVPDIRIVGEVAATERALDDLSSREIDLVLADLRMEELNGVEFTRALKEEKPEVGVLIVTADNVPEPTADAVRRAGADGLISKNRAGSNLEGTIRRAAAGEEFFTDR